MTSNYNPLNTWADLLKSLLISEGWRTCKVFLEDADILLDGVKKLWKDIIKTNMQTEYG